MARDVDNLTPVTSRDELVAWTAQGECAPDAVALGTEHEKILYRLADHAPVIYDPPDGRGIRAVLQRLEAATGWTPLMEGAHVIGLHDADWQAAFGGTLYQQGRGSHGCVNLPVGSAADLFGIIQSGDVVVCHW